MSQPRDEIQDVLDQLAVLEPGTADAPGRASHTLAAIYGQIEAGRENHPWRRLLRRWGGLTSRSNNKAAYAAVFALFIFVFAFSFPVVRAAASDFLGLFRVQKFAAISVSTEQIAILERVAAEGLTPGRFEVVQEPGPQIPAASLAEAERLTGVALRRPSALAAADEVYITEGGSGRLIIDLEGVRGILSAAGVDPMGLPDDLDGKPVEVSVFALIEQHWRGGPWMMQTASPQVAYPDHLDPIVMGQSLLQLLGMNEAESIRLAQSLDWTGTLLLPIPQQLASFREIDIDGVSGLALTGVDNESTVIIWQRDGMVYLLGGGTVATLLSLAESLSY